VGIFSIARRRFCSGADALVVDIAHGHSEVMAEAIRALKRRFPKAELVAGNVGTRTGRSS
jgi:hypothetical protein